MIHVESDDAASTPHAAESNNRIGKTGWRKCLDMEEGLWSMTRRLELLKSHGPPPSFRQGNEGTCMHG